jgi:lipid II:glycine glycyltransferase (peptidoglycan interpeptide bridge formation enzyme)
VLQTSHWAALKEPQWTSKRYLWSTSEQPLAAASVLTRRLGGLPLQLQYIPKGPLVSAGLDAWLTVLPWLEEHAKQSGALFLKIDPDVDADSALGKALVEHLQRRGWIFSNDQVQFRNTMLSDLATNEEEMLAGMKSKTRYNIRLAGRRGVQVQPSDDFETFYDLYLDTSIRDDFLIRPQSYYLAVMERMQGSGLGQLLMADVGGEIVAGVFLFRFGSTAWYFYGASSDQHRRDMPAYLLQWEAMRWAKAQGCSTYDWWGAPDELDEDDRMWGVYRFKKGFGGQFTRWIGAWDFAPRPRFYRTYTQIMPRVLDWMRSRMER